MHKYQSSPQDSPEYIVRKNRELSALVQMNQEIHSTMRIQRLLQILVEKAVVGLNFERGLIYLLEDDFLRCAAFLDAVKKDKATLITKPVGFGMEETAVEVLVAKLGKSIYVDNAFQDVRMSPKLLKVANTKQYCAVPLVGRERVLGVFTGDKHYSGKPIQPEDIETLELFAGHISLAIENAWLYEEKENFNRLLEEKVAERTQALEEANRQLSHRMCEASALFNLSQLLNKSLEVREVLGEVLGTVHGLGCQVCAIYSFVQTSPRLLMRLEQRSEFLHGGDNPFSPGLVARVQKSAEPFPLSELPGGLAEKFLADHCRDQGLKTGHVIPMYASGSPAAALLLLSRDPFPAWEDKKAFFASFARQAGAALERALVFKELTDQKISIEMKSEKLEQENIYLKDRMKAGPRDELIVGDSPAMKSVMDSIGQVSPTDATVIIYGETGTGKELVARAIHSQSRRREHPMITVNCAAIPEDLLESELFGHEKGAFTGAHRKRIGMFELADKSSIFLDEIGELSLKTQTKILRVLQEHEIQPIGSTASIKVDVRIIAATNRDLKEELARDRFRADLYYRLNVFPVRLPPLRHRVEDLPQLIQYFAAKSAGRGKHAIRFHHEALESFYRYRWPGNIRELQNIMERLSITCRRGEITTDDLPQDIRREQGPGTPFVPLREAVLQLKRDMVTEALQRSRGRKNQAARLLGLAPPNLSRLMKNIHLA